MKMAATYKLSDDLCTEDYVLIALHCSLEDHALAYVLNNHLKIRLGRNREDLEISGLGQFPIFDYRDQINDRYWMLITNNYNKEEQRHSLDLFQNEWSLTVSHLIPEHREVDYFLRVEQGDECLEYDIIQTIKTIPNIVTAYLVNTERLKSKHNLIF